MLEQTYYSLHRERAIETVQKRQDLIKEWYDKYRIGKKCKDCDLEVTQKLLRTFHYHHKNPETKFLAISDMVTKGYAIESILKEIKKCVLLCRECHTDRHA